METKKIAVIIDTLNGGGAEKICLTLTKAFNDNGIESHLIVLKRKCSYTLSDQNHIHFIYNNPKIKLHKKSVQLDAAKKLNSLANKLGGFDAYFSNLDNCHPIVDKACLPNCLYVIHNSIEHILKASKQLGPLKYRRKLNAFKSLNNKNIITVSNGIRKEIDTLNHVNAKSITTIYNPIDIDDIREKSILSRDDIPSSPYIIYAGRIATQKRLDVLIKAFQLLQTEVDLVILSNNPRKLTSIIKRYNSKDKNIIVRNFRQNPYPWIKNAKTLVLSSDFEGLGMVLIEALAVGTPTVSTDCPHGPNEIMTGELAKYLAPPGDYKTLAKKIDDAIGSSINTPQILEEVTLKRAVQKYIQSTQNLCTPPSLQITFYLPSDTQLDKFDTAPPYTSLQEISQGEEPWILQTYKILKHFGLDVKISNTLPNKGALVFDQRNITSLFKERYKDLNKLILVGYRGNAHDMYIHDFELLHSSYLADYDRRFPISHWPAPGIIPRKKSRADTIKRIAFEGFPPPHQGFQSQEWFDFLKSLGIESVHNCFTAAQKKGSEFSASSRTDYSDIDLIVAMNTGQNRYITNNPALQLYNAWQAGVPVILSHEQTYREIGLPGEDYIEAACLEDAKQAIKQLIERPDTYRKMRESGNKKARQYTYEAVFRAWKHFFEEVLPEKISEREKKISYKVSRYIPIKIRYRLTFVSRWLIRKKTNKYV
ncbi:MAG: glycosyltransferase [Agarilytica sp.]